MLNDLFYGPKIIILISKMTLMDNLNFISLRASNDL